MAAAKIKHADVFCKALDLCVLHNIVRLGLDHHFGAVSGLFAYYPHPGPGE